MVQTYYHTQETVCSNARSLFLLSVLSLLQIDIPATREKYCIREVRNVIKSLPNLLPSSIPLPCWLRRDTTTRWTRREGRHPPGCRTIAAAVIAGKWAEEPGLFMLSNHRTRAYAVCALRSAHAKCNRRRGNSISRAPAHARGSRR